MTSSITPIAEAKGQNGPQQLITKAKSQSETQPSIADATILLAPEPDDGAIIHRDGTVTRPGKTLLPKSGEGFASKSLTTKSSEPISTDRPRFATARIVAIRIRLAELAIVGHELAASRRRFRMAAFLKWQALAAARRRRAKNAGGRPPAKSTNGERHAHADGGG